MSPKFVELTEFETNNLTAVNMNLVRNLINDNDYTCVVFDGNHMIKVKETIPEIFSLLIGEDITIGDE